MRWPPFLITNRAIDVVKLPLRTSAGGHSPELSEFATLDCSLFPKPSCRLAQSGPALIVVN